MPLRQLYRMRWAVRATLALGVAASVLANILHAEDNPISQAIAAWPPLALLLTIELISRVPVHRKSLAAARLAATATIAGIAAWVSYWHMVGVAARYGETGASPYLLPLSVDGLIVVASICLVELGGRISAAEAERQVQARVVPQPRSASASPARQRRTGDTGRAESQRQTGDTGRAESQRRTGTTEPEETKTTGTSAKATGNRGRPRRSVAETLALAAEIEAARPGATEAEVARELGITPARLRAVRRQARNLEMAA